MLRLRADVTELIVDCFEKNEDFNSSRDLAMRILINEQDYCPSYFAMYVDSAMQTKGIFQG